MGYKSHGPQWATKVTALNGLQKSQIWGDWDGTEGEGTEMIGFLCMFGATVKSSSNSEKGGEWFGESGSESEEKDSTITELGLGEPGSNESGTLSGPASRKEEGPGIWAGEGTRPNKEGLGGALSIEGLKSEGVGSGARDGLAELGRAEQGREI
ncbi:glycoside hydrolase family 3 protein [Striga asiatica]|uniref:Glycoside hydrolase family 3 protein n=1 Tax=Striga asiatica TaxID=4170 RepID=A0A5A7PTE4_STRAF|nr:glycoside hydrolase family 3 protein [Striga asiatica]